MFISGLNLSNFKRFEDQFVDLSSQITLLLGPNSSGKSSIIKSVLGLKQTVSPTNEHEVFAAQGDYVELGTYGDYVYKHLKSKSIELAFDIKEMPSSFAYATINNSKIKFTIKYVYDSISDQARIESISIDNILEDASFVSLFKLVKKGTVRDSYWLNSTDAVIEPLKKVYGGPNQNKFIGCKKLSLKHLERFKFVHISKGQPYGFVVFNVFAEMLVQFTRTLERDVFYLGPLRSSPARSYIRTSHRREVGPKGEHTPSVFATLEKRQKKVTTGKSKSELKTNYDLLNKWTEILFPGKQVVTETFGELVKLKVKSCDNKSNRRTDSINDVGFGFSQIFPILVQSAVMPVNSTLIIEQPELHLHPKAQACLAQIIASATVFGRRFIIETHSEHFVRGLQLAVSEKRKGNAEGISKDSLKMYYVPEEGALQLMKVNEWGELLDDWPSGFFDEAYNLSYKLMMNRMDEAESSNATEVE